MKSGMKRFYIMVFVLAAAVFMLFVSMVVPMLTTGADFSILNPGWNGCSELGSEYYEGGSLVPNYELAGTGEELAVSQVDLTEHELGPRDMAVVILRPRELLTEEETLHLRLFIRKGGTLLLADDFGTGNQMLEGLGLTSRFSNGHFVSYAHNIKPEFSVTRDISPPFNSNVSFLLLNHPSTIIAGENTTVHANTTLGWLDADRDYSHSPAELAGAFPLLAVETLGGGMVVLLSDPSVMINSMLPKASNRNFTHNLFEFVIPPGGRVLFDESHNGAEDTLTSAGVFISNMPPLFTGVLLAGFLGAAVFLSLDIDPVSAEAYLKHPAAVRARENVIRTLERFYPRPKPAGLNVVDAVARKHPEWDRRLLLKLVDSAGEDQ